MLLFCIFYLSLDISAEHAVVIMQSKKKKKHPHWVRSEEKGRLGDGWSDINRLETETEKLGTSCQRTQSIAARMARAQSFVATGSVVLERLND